MQLLEKVVPRKRTQIDIRLPLEVKERIKIAAYWSGISVSEFVRRTLNDKADKILEDFEKRSSLTVELQIDCATIGNYAEAIAHYYRQTRTRVRRLLSDGNVVLYESPS